MSVSYYIPVVCMCIPTYVTIGQRVFDFALSCFFALGGLFNFVVIETSRHAKKKTEEKKLLRPPPHQG